ncbi:MAG: N-formylglutamate amidohydrolase [Candidatus Saccharimonas sp.]|nr:N-formylglutamate amidohydrolase [Candidatus Saccharimonas sp.]
MQSIKNSASLPVIYTAHHASHDFHEFSQRCTLTDEERIRFSDYGTAETVPRNGIAALVASHSRALGDLNRDPDDAGRFQEYDYARPSRNPIWLPGKTLSEKEKAELHQRFYIPFHNEIIHQLRAVTQPMLVVAWDNTADYIIGKNNVGDDVQMPSFVLSNRGGEETAETSDEETSCDPLLFTTLRDNFVRELQSAGLPHDVHLNLVYRGGYITRRYSTRRAAKALHELGITQPIQSLQLEYNTKLTHDQITLDPNPEAITRLRQAFERAIDQTLREVTLA